MTKGNCYPSSCAGGVSDPNRWQVLGQTQYAYDHLDRLIQVTDADNRPTTITYDVRGFKSEMDDPDMGRWFYKYGAAGNLAPQIDARLKAVNFYYDPLGRLKGKIFLTVTGDPGIYNPPTGKDYPDFALKYYYDAGTNGKGHRNSMADASGTTAWQYDQSGRLTKSTQTVTGSGTFVTEWGGFDPLDRPGGLKYPGGNASESGEQVTYTYVPRSVGEWGGARYIVTTALATS